MTTVRMNVTPHGILTRGSAMKWFVGRCSTFIFILCIALAMPVLSSATPPYTGGYLDDGLYDDDWYYDYYELSAEYRYRPDTQDDQDKLREYEASQIYEGAEESGIFNF
jgi:hypothetical protein